MRRRKQFAPPFPTIRVAWTTDDTLYTIPLLFPLAFLTSLPPLWIFSFFHFLSRFLPFSRENLTRSSRTIKEF
ncbi:hypothetical protein L6164_027090 [Bauhinia variegata]|uniref:Uncharacterized protein n=1 Tax=Bauhinia variegata TaxID=167791 RepID=A0ACB9LRW6_BAUVA|nr:hypothetical protein L6164_027090 [Bauhinia variegata]